MVYNGRVAGWPGGRVAGWPGGRVAGWPVPTGSRSSSARVRVEARTGQGIGMGLAGTPLVLLALPLAAWSPAARAQTVTYSISPTEIHEGERLAFAEMDTDAGMVSNQSNLTFTNSDWNVPPTVKAPAATSGLTINAQAQKMINICDRTPEIELEILQALGKTETDCGSIIPADLARIATISYQNKSLTALKAGDFDNLTSLTALDLSENSLRSLPAGVFDNLTSLTTLDLYSNSLSSLPAGVFDNLTSLTTLDLHSNSLSSLPASVFDNLTSLTTLDLHSNSLSSLPAGVFDNLTKLQSLYLYSNNLSSLPTGVFDNLTSLTALDMGRRNSLSSLPTGVFDGPTSLQWLNLSENSLSSLPTGVFDNLTSLQSLHMNDNSLSSLPAGVFDNLTSLQLLALHANYNLTCLPSIPSSVITLSLDKARSAYPACAGVTVTEPDGATRVTEASGMDHTDRYTVVLDSEPTTEVTITVKSGDSGAATVSPATLTFATTNWNTAQTVTVTGVDDQVDQSSDRSVTISHSATSSDTTYDQINIANVTATVMDDDVRGVTVSASSSSLRISEADDGGTDEVTENVGNYTVALTSEPTGNVAITVESGTPSAATVSPATLTFTSSNWSSAQTVTVTGVDDGLDNPGDQRQATISHDVSGAGTDYEEETAASVVVTVTDDDGAGVTIKESDGSTSVTEKSGDGRSDTYTAVLDSEPTAEVTITVESGDSGAATVSPATLTFATTNWNTAQTVTVTGVDDQVDQSSDRSVTISHSATSSDTTYDQINIANVTATVMDDDVRGVTVSASSSSLRISEADDGGTDEVTENVGNYTVALTSEPTGNVAITVESGTPSAATVSPATLTFTSSNWSSAQTVTVTGVDDGLDNPGDQRQATISHDVSGAGTDYEEETAASVVVTVTDDDGAGVTIKESDGSTSVTEKSGDGRSDTYTVVLDSEPTAEVTITVESGDSGAATVSPATLTFATTNWNTAQTVTVTGVDDQVDQSSDRSVTISHSATSSDTTYDQINIANVTATVMDNDMVGVTITESDGFTSVTEASGEGHTDTYIIVLDSQPTANVGIEAASGTTTAATVSPATLTFNPSTWNTAQTVTVTGVDDKVDQSGNRTATISHSATSSDAQYNNISISSVTATVTATVVDDDLGLKLKGWHLRFGRAVSQQVVDALQDRFCTHPAAALQLTVAGEPITSVTPLEYNQGMVSKALGFETVTTAGLVEGSSFSFAPEASEAEGEVPHLAFWGQGALSSFTGQEDGSSLDGDVTTALLGADWSTERWQAGAALSQSWGRGSHQGDRADGEVSSTLTGLFPYGCHALTPRLGIWATAGYGWGELSSSPMRSEYTPSTTMGMVAVGLDGVLLDGGSEGITLTTTADVLTVRTSLEEVDGLESSEGSLSRRRVGLEAIRPFPLSNGASLLPSMALGIRHDSGDAETGYGLDLGAAIRWKHPKRGISGALKGHSLLTHTTEESLQEQGLALSFSWQPHPSNRGPSLSLSHAMEVLNATPSSGQQQFEAELAYGFPAYNDYITLTPALALAFSPTSRNYSLLWSLAPYAEQLHEKPWELSLMGERQEQNNRAPSPVDHSLKLTFSTLF